MVIHKQVPQIFMHFPRHLTYINRGHHSRFLIRREKALVSANAINSVTNAAKPNKTPLESSWILSDCDDVVCFSLNQYSLRS